MRLGCIGIGSNAIRLLTAAWNGETLLDEHRERVGTRLFSGLVNGALTEESIESSLRAIAGLTDMAREDGVRELFVFATSAVRDASNGLLFTERASRVCGANVEILSGEEEAVLSYVGASDGGVCGVIDIGGGSTEFTLGEGERVDGVVSLQMGAVRMSGLWPIHSERDYENTLSQCAQILHTHAKALLSLPKRETWAGVGGTMTTLGAMKMRVPLFDPQTCEGMCMTREEVASWGRKLSRMPLEQRRQVVGLMPQRADIMPSGIAILESSMREFGIAALRLSAHGNMDGYLKLKFRRLSSDAAER